VTSPASTLPGTRLAPSVITWTFEQEPGIRKIIDDWNRDNPVPTQPSSRQQAAVIATRAIYAIVTAQINAGGQRRIYFRTTRAVIVESLHDPNPGVLAAVGETWTAIAYDLFKMPR